MTQRGADLPFREDAGGALVQQRNQEVVAISVHQGDPEPLEPPGGPRSREATAYDHNAA